MVAPSRGKILSVLKGYRNKPFPDKTYLKHVVEEVELDDGLALDDVVHHGGVDVGHGVDAHRDDQPLQQVDHLRRVQQVRTRPGKQHAPAKLIVTDV